MHKILIQTLKAGQSLGIITNLINAPTKKKFTVKESEYCPRRLKNTKPQKKELKDKE